MKFKVSAVLPTPANVYFVERDSAAFRSLVAQMCKLESLEMGDCWVKGDVEIYEFITKPDIGSYVPNQFKHFLPGGDLHYTDIIEYDPKMIAKSPYRMRVHSIPPIFASKSKIESWLTIEEETPETCRQTLEGSIEIKILGLGHIAERIVVDNLKNVYKGVPKIVERWVQFRNEVLKQTNGKDILVKGRPQNVGVPWINDQIRKLIKATDTDSEASTTPNSSMTESELQLPSVEDMLDRCSLDSSTSNTDVDEDDDDVFFDAKESLSQTDLSPLMDGNPKLQANLRKDTRDATELLKNVTQSGRKLRKVVVDTADAPNSPGKPTEGLEKLTPGKDSRFSKDYNAELHEWQSFWQENHVPEAKHVADFKTRLGNLFGVGAAIGMFKPGKHEHHHRRFHLRRKHRHGKHKHDDSHGTDESLPEEAAHPSAESSITDESGSFDKSANSKDSHSQGKGHRRSRSATFVKELFTGRRSRSGKEDSSKGDEV